MINAICSCPTCTSQVLALDPQPFRDSGHSTKNQMVRDYLFACNCGACWSANQESTEQHCAWLKQVGLYNPVPIHRSNNQGDIRAGMFDQFVYPRVQRVLARYT